MAWFIRAAVAAVIIAATMPPGRAADEPGSKDHPIVGRYNGSEIAFYKASEFDEASLLQKPLDYKALLDRDATKDHSGPEWLRVEGRVTRIRYAIPDGRSSLEVFRNFEQSLKAKGFAVSFTCADQACFTGTVNDPYLMGEQIDENNNVSTAYFDHARYLLATANPPTGPVHVSILAGEDKAVTTAFVEVVEPKPLETDRVAVVGASEMGAALARENRVDIYGVLFDFNRAEVKPESRPTLDQIADLMTQKPDLRLEVVGHTDNVGRPAYNLDLSARRAANVVRVLVDFYRIEPERLSYSGAGQTMPVASNDDEAGRTKNRRVELRARN